MLERASGSLANYPGHPPAAYGRLGYLVPDPILGAVKHVDFGELQQSGRKDTTRFFGTRSKVPMDWSASAIKPGRRSLNRTSMDVRRARGAIKDPRRAKSGDVTGRRLGGCRRASPRTLRAPTVRTSHDRARGR